MSAEAIAIEGATPYDVAKAWRSYVQNPPSYTEELWQAAQARGLAEFRVVHSKRWDGKQVKNVPHEERRWILTEAGLDLYIAGAEPGHVWPSVVVPPPPPEPDRGLIGDLGRGR